MEKHFEYYFETDNFHFKYAKGEPMVKSREFHDYNEFIFFMKGNSFLVSKNIQEELVPGSIIIVPKEHFHQFYINHPENYVRCILGFCESPKINNLVCEVMDMVKVIISPDEKITSVFFNLIEIIKSNLEVSEKNMFIESSLIQLLIHLKQNTSDVLLKSVKLSPLVIRAINIIDEKYTDNLSVKTIADLLYVSPSTLAHKFSKELNISIYKYLTKKRLSVAHELIRKGEPLVSAATSSGFRDYSCFYRLYKKYYKK